jgi:hypothetical protein
MDLKFGIIAGVFIFILLIYIVSARSSKTERHMPQGSSPLANAVTFRDLTEVERLLSEGISPNSEDERGTSALNIAAATDQFRMVNLLVDKGASIWSTDTLGYTAAIYAKTTHIQKDSVEGQACDDFIRKLKLSSFPWPPPFPDDVRGLMNAGNWPLQAHPASVNFEKSYIHSAKSTFLAHGFDESENQMLLSFNDKTAVVSIRPSDADPMEKGNTGARSAFEVYLDLRTHKILNSHFVR